MCVCIPAVHTDLPKRWWNYHHLYEKIIIYGYFLLPKEMLYSWYFIKMARWINNMSESLAMCHQLLVFICAVSPFEQSSNAQCSRGYSLDLICAQASCLCFVLWRLCVHNPAPLLCATVNCTVGDTGGSGYWRKSVMIVKSKSEQIYTSFQEETEKLNSGKKSLDVFFTF